MFVRVRVVLNHYITCQQTEMPSVHRSFMCNYSGKNRFVLFKGKRNFVFFCFIEASNVTPTCWGERCRNVYKKHVSMGWERLETKDSLIEKNMINSDSIPIRR